MLRSKLFAGLVLVAGLVVTGNGSGQWDLRPTADLQAVALRVAEVSVGAGEANVATALGSALIANSRRRWRKPLIFQ